MSKIDLISVVMVDGGFRERFHLLDCLAHQTLPQDRYELLWIEYYGRVQPELARREEVRVITLNQPPEKPYHASYCFNEGIRRSRGELLVIPDADVVVGPHFLETIRREHEKYDDLVLYMPRWDEAPEQHTGDVSLEHLQEVCRFRNPTNYGGCLTVRRKWLREINGYEQHEAFAGLSANGLDVYTRFKNLGLAVKWHPTERIFHPWHPGALAGSEGYRWQLKIIEERARALTTRAYYGLDGQRRPESKPAALPPDDSQSVGEKMRRAWRDRGFFRGLCFLGARLLDRFAG